MRSRLSDARRGGIGDGVHLGDLEYCFVRFDLRHSDISAQTCDLRDRVEDPDFQRTCPGDVLVIAHSLVNDTNRMGAWASLTFKENAPELPNRRN